MTADILIGLGKANLAAAAAILLVLLARKSIRRLFGARIAYSLWLVVPLATVASLLPARTLVVQAVTPGTPQAFVGALPETSAAVLALWIAGIALSGGLLAWRQSRFVAGLGGLVRDGRYLRAGAAGVGPAVVGALFPRIVLPADFESRFDAREQDVVLAHEAAHLASGDALVNAIVALVQCVSWFNPFVHVAAHQLRIDQELACDAAVLAARPQDRRAYAEALLKTQITSTSLPLGCYWPASHGNPLKERIAMLKSPSPSRARALLGAGGIAALCLGAAFGAWAAQPAQLIEVAAQNVPADVLIESPSGQRGPIAMTTVPLSEVSGPVTRTKLASGETRTILLGNSQPRSSSAPQATAFHGEVVRESRNGQALSLTFRGEAKTQTTEVSGAVVEVVSSEGAKLAEEVRESLTYITATGERRTVPITPGGSMTIRGETP